MKKARLYSTIGAILGGLIFAYVLVQVQYGDKFLLGDVMQLTLPDDFVGVHYHVDTGALLVSVSPMDIGTKLFIDISYNPERVSLDIQALQSSQDIVSVIEHDGEVQLSIILDSADDKLFKLPLISDEEYHIVVSAASRTISGSKESLAIQRL